MSIHRHPQYTFTPRRTGFSARIVLPALVFVAAGAAVTYSAIALRTDRSFEGPRDPRPAVEQRSEADPSASSANGQGQPADATQREFFAVSSPSDVKPMFDALVQAIPTLLSAVPSEFTGLTQADQAAAAIAVRAFVEPLISGDADALGQTLLATGSAVVQAPAPDPAGKAAEPSTTPQEPGYLRTIKKLATSLNLASLDLKNVRVRKPVNPMALLSDQAAQAVAGGPASNGNGMTKVRVNGQPEELSASGPAGGGRTAAEGRSSGGEKAVQTDRIVTAASPGADAHPSQHAPVRQSRRAVMSMALSRDALAFMSDPEKSKNMIEVLIPAKIQGSDSQGPDLELGVVMYRDRARVKVANAVSTHDHGWRVLTYNLTLLSPLAESTVMSKGSPR